MMSSLNATATETCGYAPVNGLEMYYEIRGPAIRWSISLPLSDTPG
jgi:hypothetical protein